MDNPCYHCEENECVDGGALCEDCRADMWLDQRTHHEGEPIERTVEDVTRANGGRI